MRISVICAAGCIAPLLAAQSPPCRTIESDRVFAKDLAGAIDAFSAIPPETPVALAPLPGLQRTLKSAEVLNLARRYSLPFKDAHDVCFEWRMEPLDRGRVMEVMRRVLGMAEARIEIVELSNSPVPHGEIRFDLKRLGTPARTDRPSPVLWRGDVIYGGDRRFGIWARVEITAPSTRVVAAGALKPGEPIAAAQLRSEVVETFPLAGRITAIDQVVGMSPRRLLPAGSEVRRADLIGPKDVNPGDDVAVEVRAGATRLAFTGKAMTAGSIGDTVSIRNPDTKKSFQARVTGTRTALVQATGSRVN